MFSKCYSFFFVLWSIFIIFTSLGCKSEPPKVAKLPSNLDSLRQNVGFDLAYFKKENDAYILDWPLLMSVKFEEKYSEKMAMKVEYPLFSDTIRALDGKQVQVEGYYIPVSETGDDNIVILSAYPFAQCFFCGKAGVESIIDILSPKKVPQMKLDSKIKFRGRLKLNRDNFDYLIYVLEEAELVE